MPTPRRSAGPLTALLALAAGLAYAAHPTPRLPHQMPLSVRWPVGLRLRPWKHPMKVVQKELADEFTDPQRKWLINLLIARAKAYGLQPAHVLAIASRETNIRNIAGDYEKGHGYHGFGPMQLDDRSHGIPDGWQNHPQLVIDPCCQILADNLLWARKSYPKFNAYKISSAAYNSGRENTAEAIADHGDCDWNTTDRDYGQDVCQRLAQFAVLLGATQ